METRESENFEDAGTESPLAIPSGVIVDLVRCNDAGGMTFEDNQNIGDLLRSHNKAILFAVPGAFTPTCSGKHFPSFVDLIKELKEKGIEAIYCLSVNDKFVMKAWAESTPSCVESGIVMVADGNAEFTRSMGLSNDRTANRMGTRSKRYSMIVENGSIVKLLVDEAGYNVSSAQHVLSLL